MAENAKVTSEPAKDAKWKSFRVASFAIFAKHLCGLCVKATAESERHCVVDRRNARSPVKPAKDAKWKGFRGSVFVNFVNAFASFAF
ncbi:MAG: hypothetical protein R2682_06165 [Pyrinomonadaceae bacterium]